MNIKIPQAVLIISGNRALRTAEMDSLGGNLSHAPVMKNAPNTLSTVRCMFTTRPWGEIHHFSNSGEALGIHCDVYEHMVSPGAFPMLALAGR